jgi:hypothetical protein
LYKCNIYKGFDVWWNIAKNKNSIHLTKYTPIELKMLGAFGDEHNTESVPIVVHANDPAAAATFWTSVSPLNN